MTWWHHACDQCLATRHPDMPAELVDYMREAIEGRELVWCCFCGASTPEGIRLRDARQAGPHCGGHEDGEGPGDWRTP